MSAQLPSSSSPSIPPWRDARVLGIVFQVLVLAVVLVVGGFLLNNALTAMDQRGFLPSLDFLDATAGFDIAEQYIPFEARDSYGQALLVGMITTLVVSFVGIVLATIIGLVVGIARLSKNWLVSKLALGFVELFRNTPLLLQLIVIYFAVFLQLPGPKEAITLPGSIYISKSGLDMPTARLTDASGPWLISIVIAIGVAIALWFVARRRDAAATPSRGLRPLALLLLFAIPLVAYFLSGSPLRFEEPELGRFNFSGGLALSAEFAALTLGLALYTAAFIAEIIRGAIEAVSKGQIEASRAIGLKERETLRYVVLPQAMRVIIPPLTSQYLNLIKNSSLALVIGFQDVFGISRTITTQTGQPISVLMVVMAFYLAISLLVSGLMNLYNRRVQIKER